ncbi:AAA domain-containing protein [Metabacillus malikii]|uniref:DNA helicase n=1 Tax=Metabacillus malikii TaxID=1504265 RepID=A0ABT9ZCS2_9BACI|nr:AAA domain-containing protein [Metabacillus malikii]MDQ0230042.1 hypothetical protein [Metabacillus malikii]
MKSTNFYLNVWQKALRAEISHLKKYGSSKYVLKNGQPMTASNGTYTYYFETTQTTRIPNGSKISIEPIAMTGRILSSEGKSIIIAVEAPIGSLQQLYLVYDPWELLDQLHDRLDEIKESKQKRTRIKKLMNPPLEVKHPTDSISSNVHELVLRSKYNPVTFVWGPPGTGKTYTLGRVAANKYFKHKTVLILAQSNQAVDVLIAETTQFIHKKGKLKRTGDVLRYGAHTEKSTHFMTTSELLNIHNPSLATNRQALIEERKGLKETLGNSYTNRDSEQLLKLELKLSQMHEKIREQELSFVNDAEIIGTTLAKAATDPAIYEKQYDLVIVDEASMAYVPQIAFAASLAKRTIVCGDFKQLPPIATARHKLVDEWLREDIFHKAQVVNWVQDKQKHSIHPHLFLLKEQRRMHPDISAFTNKHIYNSLVGDHESVKRSRTPIVERPPFENLASILVNTSGMGNYCLREKSTNSRFNIWHLLLSFQVIHEAYLSGAKSIGFVTPYRAQAYLMDLLLSDLYEEELLEADIIAATVHKFQGSERDVMIFDVVDSYPQERPGMLLVGKDSERLINVAITRTRGKFVHICNEQFIRSNVYRNKTIHQLVNHQTTNQQIIQSRQIGSWVKNQHPKLLWIHAKKLEKLKDDIIHAKHTIFIYIPDRKKLTQEWRNILNTRHPSTTLEVFSTNDVKQKNKTDTSVAVPFPFIIIDKKYLWLGLPFETTMHVQPPYIAARLHSKQVIEYVLSEIVI